MVRICSRLVLVCAVSAGCLWSIATGARAQEAQAAAPAVAPSPAAYYVEFRAAIIGTYGHSYVVYGRLNARGQPADAHYTDLHPMGNYAIMAIGHLLPVPANTQWDPDVLKLPVSSSYRRKLNAAEYQRLVAAVRRAQANRHPMWNAVTNNCNHYVAELAQSIGLRTPNDFQFSIAFIPALREMNESGPHPAATSRAKTIKRTAAPAEQQPRS